jgi:FlaA1/EpsC-like NDP-sugar epimerase
MPRKPSGLFCSHACGETAEKINKLLEQFPRRLFRICNKCHAETSPGSEKPMDFSGGFRGIKPEDLLGRKQAVLDMEGIKAYVRSKTVLVTGGAGSVGSEICRQVLDYECGKLIILDINENGLFELDNELKRQYDTGRYEIVVGSVRDNGCLAHVFNQHEVHTVFHAAAHKHVPLMESNPAEAIKNNIFGTLNLSSRAIDAGAEKFILISTDKAVNCTSIMALPRRAEIMVQMQNCCSPVTGWRPFASAMCSEQWNVLLTFQDQIKKGGPSPFTHPNGALFHDDHGSGELVLQPALWQTGARSLSWIWVNGQNP